jgi:predicted nucleic acid-binding Zn ribbon protein
VSDAGDGGRRGPDEKRRGMERLGDLLPQAAREFGLEDQLEQAVVAAAWLEVVAQLVPAAAGACRMIGLDHGTVTVAAAEPIVAQEIRLRSPELLSALRTRTGTPLRQLRVVARHV